MKLRYPRVGFSCQRCAKCCADSEERERLIVILGSEVREISAYTGLPPGRFCKRAPEELMEICAPYEHEILKVDGRCIFLRGRSCAIYEARPLVCRFHPFWLEREDDTWVFGVDAKCPGLSSRSPLSRRYFLELLRLALSKLKKDGGRGYS